MPEPRYTGNIKLEGRPQVKNPDGTVSTEMSFSINEDGKEILLPSIINGKRVSEKEAIDHYHKTGEHLGVFSSVAEANEMAHRIHSRRLEPTAADTFIDQEVEKRLAKIDPALRK